MSEAAVAEAQRWLAEGRPRRAEAVLSLALAENPEDDEALYALAVAQRHRWRAALETLAGILERRPNFGRAHQEVGYNHIAQRDFARAGPAFERAVNADPSLINSWKCLAKLYHDSGNAPRRAAAEQQIDYLGGLPPELLAVVGYLSEDRLADAERLCKHFLQSNTTHVEGMRLLAEVATRNKVLDEAEFLLESCVEFEPTHRQARCCARRSSPRQANRPSGSRPSREMSRPRMRAPRSGRSRRTRWPSTRSTPRRSPASGAMPRRSTPIAA